MPPTGRIFLSYRRDDSRYATRGIYDRLATHFGEDAVFMDVDTIPAGLDFVKVLQREVQRCDILVAVVGKSWLNIKDEAGNRRLDNPEDFVRIEVATALERDIRVIPVLLDGVFMPRSTELPDNLKTFARRNAIQVKHDSFGSDVYRLIKQLEKAFEEIERDKADQARLAAAETARLAQKAKIEKLHTQADTAVSLQDWALAQRKLKNILALDADDLQAQAKLELVDEKLTALAEEEQAQRIAQEEALKEKAARAQAQVAQERADRLARQKRDAEEKARQDALKEERRQERIDNIRNFFSKNAKGLLFGIGGITLLFLLGLIISNIDFAPQPEPTDVAGLATTPLSVAPTSVLIGETATAQALSVAPTSVLGEELGVGSTMVSEKDGMVMVYVPAGEFQMGSEDGGSDEKPIHTVYLDAYWIDQTEVTNAMFANYLNSLVASITIEDSEKVVYDGDIIYDLICTGCENWEDRILWNGDEFSVVKGYEQHPVALVSWYGANAYCSSVERRLPTEAEWEKAASWDDVSQVQRVYPWGDDFASGEANFCDSNCFYNWKNDNYDDGYADTSPIGSYESGKSFYGAFDMSGNVWEWVDDWYDAYPGNTVSNPSYGTTYKVLRGGSWFDDENILRVSYRIGYNPDLRNVSRGFRCSR